MHRSVELCQLVSIAVNHTAWNIPRIRDGTIWRNIENASLLANPYHINGQDLYEDAIFRAKKLMEHRGWATELSEDQVQCHEHLTYQHYRLKCWK
jgi:hypothetical protein